MKVIQFIGAGLVGCVIGAIMLIVTGIVLGMVLAFKYHNDDDEMYNRKMHEVTDNITLPVAVIYWVVVAGLGMYFIMPLFG